MKRKGFTLVELLIVVVVIGVLSSMMMMSSSEAVTTSKASNIISNLRSLSSAAMALYIDSFDTWESEANVFPTSKDIMNYINNSQQVRDFNRYDIELTGDNTQKASARSWYITYSFTNEGSDKDRIKAKVAGRARSTGLIGVQNNGINNIDDKKIYTNEEKIALKVR